MNNQNNNNNNNNNVAGHKPGILTIDIGDGVNIINDESDSKKLNISIKIPRQTLLLQNVLVKGYESASPVVHGYDSLKDLGVLYVEITTDQGNLFSYNLMVDNNVGRTNIPILLNDSATIFTAHTLQLPVYTNSEVPHIIQRIRLLDKNGNLTTKVTRVVLQFSYQGIN